MPATYRLITKVRPATFGALQFANAWLSTGPSPELHIEDADRVNCFMITTTWTKHRLLTYLSRELDALNLALAECSQIEGSPVVTGTYARIS